MAVAAREYRWYNDESELMFDSISHKPDIYFTVDNSFKQGGLFIDYKKEIIELLDKLDERKLTLVFWHIKGLLGIK